MYLPGKGNCNAMRAFRNDEQQQEMVQSLRRKQKIYKELAQDRSARDSLIGQQFYEAAEKLDQQVTEKKTFKWKAFSLTRII